MLRGALQHHRRLSTLLEGKTWSPDGRKLKASPMVYISGEEMTRYAMELILDRWIRPSIDTSSWEFYDLSVLSRDKTDDAVLKQAVQAGTRLKSIFKEPTVTPSEAQKEAMGLKKAWGSPNGPMRRGWNGITISRDTIHIEGMTLGFKHPVLFDRHAVGGEYSAGWKPVGKGTVKTVFTPKNGTEVIVDSRDLTDEQSVVVTYDNPLDNVTDLGHLFFSRCLEMHVIPYVVTKKTVFKWQEGFWLKMKQVYDAEYKQKFLEAGISAPGKHSELQHLISDSATMQIIRWTNGGFGMASHNYDGDVLSDEIAQVHRSPGFMTSNLVGKDKDDGRVIREFEASHGTVTDLWNSHLRGDETSLNPLGMVEALLNAMKFAAEMDAQNPDQQKILDFCEDVRMTVHRSFVAGHGTRDMCGAEGLTTEAFVDIVGSVLDGTLPKTVFNVKRAKKQSKPVVAEKSFQMMDENLVRKMFNELDVNNDGRLDFQEFLHAVVRLGISPNKFVFSGGESDKK